MLEQPLTLPCGAVVPNRLCKAAMTEGLAHPDGSASEALARLYGVWSDGGSGILLSGNIQVDGDHLERPGNVVVDDELSETAFNALAEMARQGSHQLQCAFDPVHDRCRPGKDALEEQVHND